jgi:quercetin dioxygenase-like cupin family protein
VNVDAPDIEAQVRRSVGAAAEATDFGSVQWASREGDPAGAEMTVGLAVFHAGKSNVEHVHPNCEEAVYVLEGEVEHTLGDQRTVLRAGDLIVVPRGVPHRLLNRGNAPIRAFIVFSAPDRQFQPTGR